ncbi:MAG: O-antigen ligase family protein [Planctomycetota bacterium]
MSVRPRLETGGVTLAALGLATAMLLPAQRAAFDARMLAIFALGAGGALLLTADAFARRRPVLFGSWRLAGLALLALLALVRGPLSAEGTERVLLWLGLITAASGLAGALDDRDRADGLALLLAALALGSLEGLLERTFLLDARRAAATAVAADWQPFFSSDRARSVFGQANAFGGFLLLLLPLVAAGLASAKRRSAALLLAVALGALAASGSRGTMVALVLVAGAASAFARSESPRARRVLRLVRIALGLAGLGAAAIWALVATGHLGAEDSALLETLAFRRDYAHQALRVAADRPVLGVGLTMYGEASREVVRPGEEWSLFPHQGYLWLHAELGVIGAGLALLGLAGLRDHAGAPGPREPRGPLRPLVVAGGVAALLSASQGGLALLPPATAPTGGTLAVGVTIAAGALAFALLRPLAVALLAAPGRLRSAATFGLLGLALHALVDVDLSVRNLLATAALSLAITRPVNARGPLGRPGRALAVGGAFALLGGCLLLARESGPAGRAEAWLWAARARAATGTVVDSRFEEGLDAALLAGAEARLPLLAATLPAADRLVDRATRRAGRTADLERALALLGDAGEAIDRPAAARRRRILAAWREAGGADDPVTLARLREDYRAAAR